MTVLTVQDVLELDILTGAKPLTAKQILSKQLVEWVSIMDIPVENYIRKNEFVLNTGAGSGNNMDLFYQFVVSVYDSGASALGIAIGKYITEIPQSVLDFAEEKEFPIIEIPWEKRFAEISHFIMNEINREQNKEFQKGEGIQQKLLNMMLGHHTLSKITDFIGEKIGQSLIVVDKTGAIKGKSTNANELIEKWNHHISTNDVYTRASFLDSKHPLLNRIERIKIDKYVILQIPIQSANRILGYLIMGLNDEAKVKSILHNQTVSILEHASTVLAMWFLRENAIEETKMKLRGDFVWSLANGEFSNWDQKILQAKSLGYILDLPFICLIGAPENLQELYQKSRSDISFERWRESMLHYIQDEMFQSANLIRQKVMITEHKNDLIIFLENTRNQNYDKVNYYLEILNRRLNKLLPGVILSWGIGRCHEGEWRFSESFKDAQEALKIGRKKAGPGCCITFDETRMERALLRIAKDQEISEIVTKTIKTLIDYDNQKNANMIETVMAYNANQGKTSQTARDLHLHRHTLLYRLKKIEQITNLSLFNPEDRFLLELSIKLWKLEEAAQ